MMRMARMPSHRASDIASRQPAPLQADVHRGDRLFSLWRRLHLGADRAAADSLQRRLTLQYDMAWSSQAALEVARLEAAVGASTIPGSRSIRTTSALARYRRQPGHSLLSSGEVHDFIQSDPQLQAIDGDFRACRRGGAAVASIARSAGQRRACCCAILPTEPEADAPRFGGVHAKRRSGRARLEQLSRLHWIFSGVLRWLDPCSLDLIRSCSGTTGCSARRTDEVNGLVTDLKRTGEELSAAKHGRIMRDGRGAAAEPDPEGARMPSCTPSTPASMPR